MASSTKSISAAIKSIPAKKESLRKAFEDLQSHSSSLASFTLQWKDIEAHFNSIEKSIETSFKEVELKEKSTAKNSEEKSIKQEEESIEVTPRPELKSLCEKMDGKGLRCFISENRKEIPTLRNEITEAIRLAPDPGKMVLDAMEGFYSSDDLNLKGDKDVELAGIRRSCILLLERLVFISPEIINTHKDRAKKLAVEWKRKIINTHKERAKKYPGGENALEIFGFMQLLVTFGLVSAFDVEELLDLFFFVARRNQAIDLFKALDLTEKVPDFIQKLARMGKQLQAVKFVYAFGLVDKFPPGPLLKAYLKESKKVAQEIRKKGNNSAVSQNEATAKEIAAVKAVIQSVKEHKLETEFSSMNLENRISQLEQQKAQRANKKRAALVDPTPPTPKSQQRPPNKKPRPSATTTPYVPPPTAPQRAPNQQQPQPSVPLVDWIPSYSGSAYSGSTGPYGLAGPGMAGTFTPYDRPGTSFPGTSLGFGASPPKSHLYSSEHLLGSSMYDNKPLGYSGYTLSGGSSYNPPYYP
ncbi:truncated FRIGIDA-like protein 1 [Tasmannia lanceolata]|uniref:truncated FRIGIDA-like protein 1 n=1 Tax=Tasmannia lanceolata TaxID=3420 RepID=UPI004064C7AF